MNDDEFASHYRLKFGRHKGQLISKTARTYLEWLYGQHISPKLLPEESRKLIATRIGVEYEPVPKPKDLDSIITALYGSLPIPTLSGANHKEGAGHGN